MEDGNEAEISESEEPTDSGVIVPSLCQGGTLIPGLPQFTIYSLE